MLKKILHIQNVGKFRSCKPKGDVEFRKLTLVYAENGRGKTTLCDILRSLGTGNGDLIRGRETLGLGTEPSIELRFDVTNIRFQGGSWSSQYADLAIFDNAFVHENVHGGECVEHDQRRNLYSVIIGADGVALQRRVDEIDGQSRDSARRVRTATQALRGYLPDGIGVNEFAGLAAEDDVDEKIRAKESELRALERASDIATKPSLLPLEIEGFPAPFETILQKSISDVASDVEGRVRDHVANHTAGATEEWISDGVRYQRDQTCPFCGQNTSTVELVQAYGVHFGDAFRQLQEDVESLRKDIEEFGGDAAKLARAQTLERNSGRSEFWRPFVESDEPSFDIDEIDEAISALTNAAIDLVQTKATSLAQPVASGDEFAHAFARFEEATNGVQTYNASVGNANRAIEEKRTATSAGDSTATRVNLRILQAAKRRYESEGDAACQEYLAASEEKARVEREKEEAKAALDAHGNAILPRFEQRINQLLQQFGAGFRIVRVERRFAGGRASSSYQLLINEVPVELGDSSTPVSNASFRNTLSAGDRSTLAFAFFVAQLEFDSRLAEKVVVLDDPYNSQDSARRTCTQQRIRRLVAGAKQVIVLSHEASFLRQLYELMPTADVKTVQMARVGPDDTLVAEWDVVEATRSDYHKDFLVLQRFVNEGEGEPRSVAKTIRPMLEGYLRMVFPGSFADDEWLGDFIRKIRDAAEEDSLSGMKPALEELEDVNDFSKRYHHNTNPGAADAEPINETELRAFTDRALKLVSAPP